MTGGRREARRCPTSDDETFCLTYGDGVADIDIGALIALTAKHGRAATITAVQPPGRFGALELDGPAVRRVRREATGDGAWINGGFFVLEPSIGDAIAGDDTLVGGAAVARSRRPRRAGRLPPRRILEGHGHAARAQRARGAVGLRKRAVVHVVIRGRQATAVAFANAVI